ncbi:endolytic transglycosylase MltG [Dyella sp.]|uniref:endolytic transglycosylase MltG n=1 Tax=Dyella sp. TaxID=1869338 RepID=UPI002ED5087A
MSGSKQTGGALLRVLLMVIVLVIAASVAYGWYDFARFSRTPLTLDTTNQSIDIGRGSSFKDIVDELRRRGFTRASPLYWRLLAEQMRVAGKLHAGEYALTGGMTPRDLLINMASGKVMQRYFTIVEGWNFRELRQALTRADRLRQDGAVLDDKALMEKIGNPGEEPEGRFLPETYAYVKGDSDLDILKRAHAAMIKALDKAWSERDKDLPLASAYEALILASIVEKETGRAEERPKIAGVFVRRLQLHMFLQTDPTVIYGMGDSYAGTIHKSDLTTDTPYNTYTRPGLPPTPIAMPGKKALDAAVHPAKGSELYFVARGNGTHVFSSTLDEHNRNVACFQLKRCS